MADKISNELVSPIQSSDSTHNLLSSSGTKRGRSSKSNHVGEFRDYSDDVLSEFSTHTPVKSKLDDKTQHSDDQINLDSDNNLEEFRRSNPHPPKSPQVDPKSSTDLSNDIDPCVELSRPVEPQQSDFDAEFLTLLDSFAQLDLPTYYSEEEECFMCHAIFKTVDFATHVYECIKSLEPEEKRAIEELDYQLALQLSVQEVDDFDFLERLSKKSDISNIVQSMNEDDMEEEQKKVFDRFIANQALIFNQYKYHQKKKVGGVECCVCGLAVESSEIDAHVLLCLNTPPELRLGPGIPSSTDSMIESNTKHDHQSSTGKQSPETHQPPILFPMKGLPTQGKIRDTSDDDYLADSPHQTAGGGLRDLPNQTPPMLLDNDLRNNDGSGCGDEPIPSPLDGDNPQISLPKLSSNTSTQSTVRSDPSTQQLHSMAKLVMSHTTKPLHDQGGVSLNSLLATFKSFGLNKENLKRAKEDIECIQPSHSSSLSQIEEECEDLPSPNHMVNNNTDDIHDDKEDEGGNVHAR